MGSLSTVYERHVGPVQSVERLYIGAGLFLVGCAFLLVAAISATTNLLTTAFSLQTWEAWELSGVLAGLGVPTVFLGIISVLPLSDETKKRVAQGSLLTVVGILLFLYAFPTRWVNDSTNYSVWVVLTYGLGAGTTLFYAFRTIATFQQRNNPGGTAVVNVESGDGAQTTSEQSSPSTSLGSGAGISTETSDDPRHNPATDDGEVIEATITSTDDSNGDGDGIGEDVRNVVDAPEDDLHEHHDKYCGSCEHFEYQQGASGMVPYCGLHDETMDDLDACREWTPNQPE